MEDKGKSVVEDGESQGSSNSSAISVGFRSNCGMNLPNLQLNHQVPDNDTPNGHNYNYYQKHETESISTIVPFDRNSITLEMGNGQTMTLGATVPLAQQLAFLNLLCSSSRTQKQEIETGVASTNKTKENESANEELVLRLHLTSQADDNHPVILSSGYSNYILEENEPGEGSSAGFKKVTCKRKPNGIGDDSRWLGLGVSTTSTASQAALEQPRAIAPASNCQPLAPVQPPNVSPQRERHVRRRIESNQDILNRAAMNNPHMQPSLIQPFTHIPGSSPSGIRDNNPATITPMQGLQGSGFTPRNNTPGNGIGIGIGIPSSSSVLPAGYFQRGNLPGYLTSSSKAPGPGPSHGNYSPGNFFATSSSVYPWPPQSLRYQRDHGEYSDKIVADIMSRRPQREQDNMAMILGSSINMFPVSREMGGAIRGGNVRSPQVPVPRRINGYNIRDTRQTVGGGGGGNLRVASNPLAADHNPSSLVSEEQMESVEVIKDVRFG